MDFGKLTDISHVDFSLPDDHAQTGMMFSQARWQEPFSLFIGATGWSNPEWKGQWYPKGTQPGDFLFHYSQQFGTIEFNTTHYRIPDHALVDRWYHLAAEGFRFCPKVPQRISHFSRLKDAHATAAFCDAMIGLKEKLGPVFIQLPEKFGPNAAADVIAFAEKWPSELPLHWEFRHPDWFKGGAFAENTFNSLEKLGHGTVITDVAGRRDVLHMRLTNPVLVLRFVGNDLHPTDYTRMEKWVARLEKWKQEGLQEAYLFIHQPEMSEVPSFCIQWGERIKQIMGMSPVVPKEILPPSVQPTLF